MIIALELFFIWAVYTLYGLATETPLPVWATSFLVIATDRATGFITDKAKARRRDLPG
ncbi:hypothetical protein [Actibacterium sp. 188UL27-1]|uniref:hypothetical protein n=1 Tax=Actibacterium sp. 188UL27-1 TaxID=2786961 RepID=UPI00195B0668|nr:hypothetical protein [Actibacterium sp. 188UL27-1]MBM7065991.1 hypothetical protein [Actibacterium sp. 188UL27-1]